jgi:photosystem II stability/assembly factor-like uncharacterized protein
MTERKDPFEKELREALRSGGERTQPPGGNDDSAELLDRIHRGAARRRTRRRAGALIATSLLSAAVLVTFPLLTPPPSGDGTAQGPAAGDRPERRDTPDPDPPTVAVPREDLPPLSERRGGSADMMDRLPPGTAVPVEDVKVTSVSGSSGEEFWLSGYGNCGDGRSCNVLGHSPDGGEYLEYTILPGNRRHTQTTVRFSGDGQTGWATNGAAVFRTDSGGRAWTRLARPPNVSVATLEAWGDEVWAIGSRTTTRETVVLAAGGGSDQLTEVHSSAQLTPVGAVALGEQAFGLARTGADRNFARTSDGGDQWANTSIGCDPADVSATAGAAWVLCDDAATLARSPDGGRTWYPEPLDSAVSGPSRIAAIDDQTAFLAADGEGWVVENTVATPADGLGDGAYSYAGFTSEEVGYVIGYDGHLCRTEDGGLSWERVDLP